MFEQPLLPLIGSVLLFVIVRLLLSGRLSSMLESREIAATLEKLALSDVDMPIPGWREVPVPEAGGIVSPSPDTRRIRPRLVPGPRRAGPV